MAEPVETFVGIEVEDLSLAPAIQRAAETAEFLMMRGRQPESFRQSERRFGLAVGASLAAVNALMAAAVARCQKAAPPADIDMVNDASGDLIYRCQHHPTSHRWKLDGTPLP